MHNHSCRQAGFTLVELTTAMLVSAILILSFSTVIIWSRQQLGDTAKRVGLGYDQVILDRYVRTKLTATISDSMRIFASSSDELSNTTSTSGVILRAVAADSTVHHIEAETGQLIWTVDSTIHYPVDSDIANLQFSERAAVSSKVLSLSMDLCSEPDTIHVQWSMTLRN